MMSGIESFVAPNLVGSCPSSNGVILSFESTTVGSSVELSVWTGGSVTEGSTGSRCDKSVGSLCCKSDAMRPGSEDGGGLSSKCDRSMGRWLLRSDSILLALDPGGSRFDRSIGTLLFKSVSTRILSEGSRASEDSGITAGPGTGCDSSLGSSCKKAMAVSKNHSLRLMKCTMTVPPRDAPPIRCSRVSLRVHAATTSPVVASPVLPPAVSSRNRERGEPSVKASTSWSVVKFDDGVTYREPNLETVEWVRDGSVVEVEVGRR